MKQKLFLILSIIVFLAVLVFVLYARFLGMDQITNTNTNIPVVKNDPGIHVITPTQDEVIASPLKITGIVNGNGWIGFEGQVGTVKLFDEKNNELGMAILTAKGEWMQAKIDFETTLWFDYSGEGSGKLVFYNENPSGELERNKTLTLLIKLIKSSSEKIIVRAYFNNNQMDANISCTKVFSVNREILKTTAVARVALEELLKGPTVSEQHAGFSTSLNKGIKIQSLVIENGVAKVDFNEELGKGVAGSCKVQAIRAQIAETLKQFSTIKSVVISINSATEDILQP